MGVNHPQITPNLQSMGKKQCLPQNKSLVQFMALFTEHMSCIIILIPCKVGLIDPILYWKKRKLREPQQAARVHTARMW